MQIDEQKVTMYPLIILLVFASIAEAFSWKSVTSGNIPYFSSTMLYQNCPFAASNDTLYVATPGGMLMRTPTGDRMWTVADGSLTSNTITAIEKSANGSVWVGCADGSIARLNPKTMSGETFSPFRNDITVNDIQLIREAEGELLISTNIGLTRMNYSTNLQQWVVKETYRNFGDIGLNPLIYDVNLIRDTIWVCTQHGLAYGLWNDPLLLSPLSWHKISGFNTDETFHLATLHDTTFVANSGGCYYLAGINPEQILSTWTHQLGVWNDTLVMIGGTDFGLRKVYDGQRIGFEDYYPFFVSTNSIIFTYVVVQDNNTDTTISRFETFDAGTHLWTFDYANTPLYPTMFGGTRRTDGTLAVICGGYRSRGVNELINNNWVYHTRYNEAGKEGYYRQDPLTIVPDAYNNLWVGSLGGGIGVFYTDSMQYFDHTVATGGHLSNRPGTNESTVPAIAILSTGRIVLLNVEASDLSKSLIVLPDGAGVRPGWQNGFWTHVGVATNSALNIVYANHILVDAWDRVWLAASGFSQRLTVYDFNGTIENLSDDNVHSFGAESGLPADLSVQSMAFGADGTLYLAMSGALYYGHVGESLTGTTFYPLQLPIPASSVTSITADATGQLWVGTTNGLALLSADGQNWVTIFHNATPNSPSGLASNSIGNLQFLPTTGELFVINESGIAILSTPFRTSGTQLGAITPAPNPFINDGSSLMKFGENGLVTNADIRVFTPSGLLVRRLSFLDAAGTGWDGRNQNGQRVASGVYYLIVSTPDGKISRGKVAVITP